MSSQALIEFKAELQGILDISEPRLEGLQELQRHEMSTEAKQLVGTSIQVHTAWVDLLRSTMANLDALVAAEYPECPQGDITFILRGELEHEANVVLAALDAFITPVPVSEVTVTFDPPEPKEP